MKLNDAFKRCTEPTTCPLFKAGGFCGREEYRSRRNNEQSDDGLVYTGKLIPITDVEECDRNFKNPLPKMFRTVPIKRTGN